MQVITFSFSRAAALLVLALLSGPVLATAEGSDADVWQPGTLLDNGCQLAFAMRSTHSTGDVAESVWFLTVASCVGNVGDGVADAWGDTIGTVVWQGDVGGAETNGFPGLQLPMALIEVGAEDRVRVVPDLKGHDGLPSHDPVRTIDVGFMDELLLPMPTVLEVQNEGRLLERAAPEWSALVEQPAAAGAPVVHLDTGGPLGVVNAMPAACCSSPGGVATVKGFFLQDIILELRAHGWPVQTWLAAQG